jgi:hypothetical protein
MHRQYFASNLLRIVWSFGRKIKQGKKKKVQFLSIGRAVGHRRFHCRWHRRMWRLNVERRQLRDFRHRGFTVEVNLGLLL